MNCPGREKHWWTPRISRTMGESRENQRDQRIGNKEDTAWPLGTVRINSDVILIYTKF